MKIKKLLLGMLVTSFTTSSFAVIGGLPNSSSNKLINSSTQFNATLELEDLFSKPGAPALSNLRSDEYSIRTNIFGDAVVLTKKFIYIYEKNKWHAIKHSVPTIYDGSSAVNVGSIKSNNIVIYNYNTQKIYLYNGVDWIISPAPFNRSSIANPRLFDYMLSMASISNISIVLNDSWWQYDGKSWEQPIAKGNAEFTFNDIQCENIGHVNNNVVKTKNNKLYIYDGQRWTNLPSLPDGYQVSYLNACSNDYINNQIDNVMVFAVSNSNNEKKELIYNRKDNKWNDISYHGENENFASPVIDKNIEFYDGGMYISHQNGNIQYRFVYDGSRWFNDAVRETNKTHVNITPKTTYTIDYQYVDKSLIIKNLKTGKSVDILDSHKYADVPINFSRYDLNSKNQVSTIDREQNGGSIFIDGHWINLNKFPNYPKENFSISDIELFDNSAIITGRNLLLNEPKIFMLHF